MRRHRGLVLLALTIALGLANPIAQLNDAGTAIAAGQVIHQWGFMTMDAVTAAWTATARAVDGSPLLQCSLQGPRLACQP